MSHELEMISGQASMAFTGSRNKIWHGLGTEVASNISTDEMLKAAKLDWQVNQVPLFAEVGGKKIPTNTTALMRSSDNKILDVVSKSWKPVQNSEAFDFFKSFVEAGDMEMNTAGALRGGQLVWALAKIKEGFKVFGRDDVESYLLFTNPHKFGNAVNVRLVMERVVCNNTLTIAMNEKTTGSYSQNHKTAFDASAAQAALGMATQSLETFKAQAELLGAKKYNKEQAMEYFTELFPVYTNEQRKSRKDISKMAQLCLDNVEIQPGADIQPGTYWQLFNSVTNIVDFQAGKTDDGRVSSAWYGAGARVKAKALEMALVA